MDVQQEAVERPADQFGIRPVRERAGVGGVVVGAVHASVQQLLIAVHLISVAAATDNAGHAFDQAEARDPKHLRPWVVLVDGARHQLDLISAEASRRGVTVHVLLDFVHVAEYVWAAAHAFHKPGTTEAKAWAADRLTAILAGQAAHTAAEMTSQAEREHLPPARREAVGACDRYLTGHLDQLHYNTALENGWPIATGAVEGACRHLIADRLDITGAHWGLHGAEAVLRLRAILANGDLDLYWRYHAAREHERLYPALDQRDYVPTA